MAFVDDFFAIVPSKIAQSVFDEFKWFVIELLGFHLKTEKESPPKSEGCYEESGLHCYQEAMGGFVLSPR